MSEVLVVTETEVLVVEDVITETLVETETEVLVEETVVTELLETAEQGPPGPPGQNADSTYIHLQTIALAVWTVPHNLNRYPAVTVVDDGLNELLADVKYISDDIVQVTHGSALTGRVFCN